MAGLSTAHAASITACFPDLETLITDVMAEWHFPGLAPVDERKLGWDVPVREILPDFKLKDPIASEKCTLRDLLTHRTGLPRHDWVHTPGHLDNAGMLAVLRHLERTKNSAAPTIQ